MEEPQIEIEGDDIVTLVYADGTRRPHHDRQQVKKIRKAIAKGEAMPNLIRNGWELEFGAPSEELRAIKRRYMPKARF